MIKSSSHNKYHVEAEIIIQAPIHKVWKIMTDIKRYGEWNGFIRSIIADKEILEKGTQMTFEVEFQNKKRARSGELIQLIQPPFEKDGKLFAEWVYDFTGFLHTIKMVRASRTQQLIQLSDTSTHYYTCEKFSGWGKLFLPLTQVQKGFITHANDLKKICELTRQA